MITQKPPYVKTFLKKYLKRLRKKDIKDQYTKEALAFYSDPMPVQEWVKRDPAEYMRRLPEFHRRIFEFMWEYDRKFEFMEFSQAYIAKECGISLKTVKRALKRFDEDGVIKTFYRHRRTSLYRMSPFFTKRSVMHKLHFILPAIRYFALSLLLSISPIGGIKRGGLPPKIKNVLIKNLTLEGAGSQGGATMSQGISPVIRQIKEIRLTKWGEMKLSCFEDSAIEHGRKQIRFARNLREPFKWFYKVCYEFSKANEIPICFDKANLLAVKHHMPSDAKMYIPLDQQPRKILKQGRDRYQTRTQSNQAHANKEIYSEYKPNHDRDNLDRVKEKEDFFASAATNSKLTPQAKAWLGLPTN